MQYFPFLFASLYGEGAYGECEYQEDCASAAANGAGGTNGAGLADTGIWIVAIATLACLLIFIALLLRWLASRNNKKVAATGLSKTKKAITKN